MRPMASMGGHDTGLVLAYEMAVTTKNCILAVTVS